MREHVTTILPGAALAVMLVLVFTSLGYSQVDPESTLYARATRFCEALTSGDADRVMAFLRAGPDSEEERLLVRSAVQAQVERLRGARFMVTSVVTMGDQGEVGVYWREAWGSETHYRFERVDGRWFLLPQ